MSPFIWLAVALVALVIEFLTPSALLSVWFSVGAMVTAGIALFSDSVALQLVIFTIVSLISFLGLRPLFMRLFNTLPIGTNVDRLIGYRGRLSESITPEKWGALIVSGLRYSVTCSKPQTILADAWVKVVAIEGAKLIVENDEER